MRAMSMWHRLMSTLAVIILVVAADCAATAQPANDLAALNKRVSELFDAGKYAEAIPLAEMSLKQTRSRKGANHIDTAARMNWLADLYRFQGRYAEAEPLYYRSIAIGEKALGAHHSDVGKWLNNLAELHRNKGSYAEAEPLYKRSLAIHEKALGPDHPVVGYSLNNLGILYHAQGRFAEAEPLLKRTLAIQEKALGAHHREVGQSLNNLAALYKDQGRYAEAETLYQRSLAIREKAQGSDHPDVGVSLSNLALLYQAQGRSAEAEPLLKRSLAIHEKALGSDHSDVGIALNNLAALHLDQGSYAEAERLLKRSIAIGEKALGVDSPLVGTRINNLAALYETQDRYAEAEPLYKRALSVREKALGPDHPEVGDSLNNLAILYHSQGRFTEAEPLYERALAIAEMALGPDHPRVGNFLHNRAQLYQAQGRYTEAAPLMKRSLAIREKALGPDHPEVGNSLNNFAALYEAQGRDAEAETLYKRSLAVLEKALGPDHPRVSTLLNNLAVLHFRQSDWGHAADFWRRSTAISVRRAQRGSASVESPESGQGGTGGFRFSATAKALHRLASDRPGDAAALTPESFATAQWAQGSEAAASLAQMAARGAAGSPQLAALVRERQDLVGEWQRRDGVQTAAVSQAPDKRDRQAEAVNVARLSEIDKRIATIDTRLKAEFPDYAALSNPEPLTVEQVQAELRADEALVLFLDTWKLDPAPEETFVWIVTKTEVRWVQSGLGTRALTREVAALRCGLDATAWNGEGGKLCGQLLKIAPDKQPSPDEPLPFDLARAHALYKALFGEVADLIKGKHLLLVPSGPLTQLPFQVLVTSLPDGVTAGEFTREAGRLGAELGPLSADNRKELPTGRTGGVRIVKPLPGGPAEAAGLRYGDILLAVDEKGFDAVPDAVATVQAAGPGRAVSLKIVREGRQLDVKLTLGTLTVKDWKPLFLDTTNAREVAWLARDHALTVLPAVSSLKALRRVAKPSAATLPMIGFGNPLLDGNQGHPQYGAYYKDQAARALAQTDCAPVVAHQTAALRGAIRSSAAVAQQGGLADVAQIRRQSPLPETGDELCAVARDLGSDVGEIRIGARATEREVKALSASGRLADFRIVHFATHGTLAGKLSGTREPGLILTPPATATADDDGYLSAGEIAGLKLDADWVILSACNTAGGGSADADGAQALSGLARAFFYAQARALLVSHWEVDSDATVKLITSAVGAIANDKSVGRAEALRRAMLAMIDTGKPHQAHPAYWAPFIVVGEGAAAR